MVSMCYWIVDKVEEGVVGIRRLKVFFIDLCLIVDFIFDGCLLGWWVMLV